MLPQFKNAVSQKNEMKWFEIKNKKFQIQIWNWRVKE